VLIFTFIIAVSNIALGFALAMYLGYGPPDLHAAWAALGMSRAGDLPAAPDALALEAALPPAPDGPAVSPAKPDLWNLDEKYVETSILRLNVAMIRSGIRASEIDGWLRACQGHSEAETIADCLRLLREDCQSYLVEQREAAQKFRNRLGELGELSAMGEEIEMANLEQEAQVETTLNNLEYMDFQSDAEAANRRLLEEIKNLRVARHRLRDNQEAAFLAVAWHLNRIDKIEKQLCRDPLTQLPNRIGLEIELYEWWKKLKHEDRQVSVALFDIDHFGAVNDQHGPLVGDRILHQVAPLLQGAVGKADLAGRWAGQRFLAAMIDIGPRTAVKNAELLRQTVEKTVFVHEGREIRITLSAAVTEVKPREVWGNVVARLESSLGQIKEGDRNRTLFHDGRDAQPVDSPTLDAKAQEIEV
jgi:diguanylate cyclase